MKKRIDRKKKTSSLNEIKSSSVIESSIIRNFVQQKLMKKWPETSPNQWSNFNEKETQKNNPIKYEIYKKIHECFLPKR